MFIPATIPEPKPIAPPPAPNPARELIAEPAAQSFVGGEFLPAWQRAPQSRISRARAVAHVAPFAEDEIVQAAPMGELIPTPDPRSSGMNSDAMNGEVIMDEPYEDDGFIVDDGMGDFGPGGFGFGCGPRDPMACERFHVCSPLSILNEASAFVGTHAFKGPLDQGLNGNFGFQEGLNTGDAIWHRHGLGYQIGGQYVESNFNGDQATGTARNGSRRQTFVTAGLFHRAFYHVGLQGGVVVDYLNDDYFVNANLTQVRSELSYLGPYGNEFGFWGAYGTRGNTFSFSNNNGPTTQRFQAIDQYNFFFRHTTPTGAQGRVWGGFTSPIVGQAATSQAAGLFGADFRVPLSNKWDMIGGFNYLIPTQGGVAGGTAEAWGLTMNLVWYPARYLRGIHNGPYRPLFNVADNNTFLVGNRPMQ
jgi:hypothetical protein